MNEKWDLRFLALAEFYASWSKDPSTQVGAVITRGKEQLSQGYNGFPQGVSDDPRLYADRGYKYEHIVHGEMNAIILARQDLRGATLYTVPFLPCSRCAAMVIQAGITRVVSYYNENPRWIDSIEKTQRMFFDAGVEFQLYNKITGEPWKPLAVPVIGSKPIQE